MINFNNDNIPDDDDSESEMNKLRDWVKRNRNNQAFSNQNTLYKQGFDDGYVMGMAEARCDARALVYNLVKLLDDEK
jgi:hypothetical protein